MVLAEQWPLPAWGHLLPNSLHHVWDARKWSTHCIIIIIIILFLHLHTQCTGKQVFNDHPLHISYNCTYQHKELLAITSTPLYYSYQSVTTTLSGSYGFHISYLLAEVLVVKE